MNIFIKKENAVFTKKSRQKNLGKKDKKRIKAQEALGGRLKACRQQKV